jgi:H+/Cl- antiporter ClcA
MALWWLLLVPCAVGLILAIALVVYLADFSRAHDTTRHRGWEDR